MKKLPETKAASQGLPKITLKISISTNHYTPFGCQETWEKNRKLRAENLCCFNSRENETIGLIIFSCLSPFSTSSRPLLSLILSQDANKALGTKQQEFFKNRKSFPFFPQFLSNQTEFNTLKKTPSSNRPHIFYL